jgi:histidine ammonia-lyase
MNVGRPIILMGKEPLTIEKVCAIAERDAEPAIDPDPELRAMIASSRKLIDDALAGARTIYGVTTGFGASVEFQVPLEVAEQMPLNLVRYHGCGTGAIFGEREAAAITAVRANSLAQGFSGVRIELLDRMCELVAKGCLPAIPEEGSVGASGDLTPLSYIGALLVGEREAWLHGKLVRAPEALAKLGMEPMTLRPKESLAIMNGTSVMSALGCLGWKRALRLARFSCTISAMASDVLHGVPQHFDDRIFELKNHPGQRQAARWIRRGVHEKNPPARVQDRYSIRCAPHVIGLILDCLPWMRRMLETEINGVNDNPIIEGYSRSAPEGRVMHAGNFYGGHACLVTDTLKNVVGNVADVLDRQVGMLCNPATNAGLPANLVARKGIDRPTHHGFKAMEISASALAAEALKMSMPASVFSRSTESYNQDKVSMGTISARESVRVLDLTETIAAIHLLAVCQAVDLRGPESCHPAGVAMRDAVRRVVPMVDADRRMDVDIQAVLQMYREGDLPIGELEFDVAEARP